MRSSWLVLAGLLPGSLLACATPAAERGSSEAAELIAEGRELLAESQPQAAQPLFERAAELDDHSLESRMWLLRSWMDQGRSNDTLDAIDALVRDGRQGPETDYLYGMAFARRAQDKLADGTADSSVRMNFEDSVGSLRKALAADPERFDDAWPVLAHAAWMTQDLPLAREAGDRAVAADPRSADGQMLLGRIAFSQFRVAHDAAGGFDAEAESAWQTAVGAFRAALELYGDPPRAGEDWLVADAQVQLANACLWKEDTACASEAYAAAIGMAPDALDYASIRPLFDPALFRDTLQDGLARWEARADTDATRDASLCWWLGWAHWTTGSPERAEELLLRALQDEPAWGNAWFYVALARYAREDWPGTVEALRTAWETDPASVVAEMQTDLEANLARVSYVVAWCVSEQRAADAALLARIDAESAPEVAALWSDLGLLLRDQGEALGSASDAQALALYEEALGAYQRALELAPDDPQILNDTAVILHYYLERDLEQALAMYARAKELAQARLDGGELDEELLAVIETALRDATNNHRLLAAALSEKGR
jgi:tetratricopeptide (TPR) repeat protein